MGLLVLPRFDDPATEQAFLRAERVERGIAIRALIVIAAVTLGSYIVLNPMHFPPSGVIAGPLVPGPGGIPLFLIGFALITFPGKRRLTARVLRGRPIALESIRLTLVTIGIALALAVPALVLAPRWSEWIARTAAGTASAR